MKLNGRALLNFSSNDTLGLAADAVLVEAAHEALASHGLGAGAAQLLTGSFDLVETLESRLASWLSAEAALVFSSGYHANVGVISALGTADRRLYSDRDNHASLIDGARLARAERRIYPHLAPPLDDLRPGDLVVTESIFSMEGVSFPSEWVSDVQSRGALAIVDEAHAIGWAGPSGSGLAGPETFCRIGTFGKALGSFGAFVAGSRELITLLRSVARTFIFTTALPAPIVAASLAAVNFVQSSEGEARRQRLSKNCALFQRLVKNELLGDGPIFSIRCGTEESALAMSAALEERGLLARAVRPPTVPENDCRVRIVISAAHLTEDIEKLSGAVNKLHIAND